MNATAQRVLELKDANEDFEWYPTTDEIIAKIAHDIKEESPGYKDTIKLLDVGAGDGRVLTGIAEKLRDCTEHWKRLYTDMFAIEIATPHLNSMPKEIVVVGTDFRQQMLVDKQMTVVFSNPPYSEYEEWSVKLIRECCTEYLYLVIPKRWRESLEIDAAIKYRDAAVEYLGEFDFESADRKARAKVEIVRIYIGRRTHDAFELAIEEMLPELEVFDRVPDDDKNAYIDRACQLIEGSDNLITSLVEAYNAELLQMVENYRSVTKLNFRVLKELNVCKEGLVRAIMEKIVGLKTKYWQVLFDRFTAITKRLATKERKQFLDSLEGKATIDFTEPNIYSMLIWISKHANAHFDDQIVHLYKRMASQCNAVRYKSNNKVWEEGQWRYLDDRPTHYKLEYRLVVEHCGGIHTSEWSYDDKNGLNATAYEFLSDCITVANNLGFDSDDSPGNYQWVSNKQNIITLNNGEPLIAVRAFKNGNIHIHWSQKIMLALNVEAGRLLGWIRNPDEAVKEMQATGDDADYIRQKFGSSFKIAPSNMLRIA